MKLRALTLAAMLAAPTVSLADADEAPEVGSISFSGGFDVVSAYYFRGYLLENQGLIFQPSLYATVQAVSSDDVSAQVVLGTWNSFHSEKTGEETDPGAWYEADLTLEVPIAFGKFTLTPLYYVYLYPNGSFETVHEVGVKLEYDDTGLLGEEIALNPYIGVYYEFQDGNGTEDGYAEIGIAPAWTPPETAGLKLPELEFPLAVGLSFDDYFVDSDGDNDILGFVSAGVTTAIPLPVPERFGAWNINVGGYYQYLFSDSLEITNNDSPHVFWGKIGMSFEF